MIETVDIKVAPKDAHVDTLILQKSITKSKRKGQVPQDWRVIRRSIDARGRNVWMQLKVELFYGESITPEPAILDNFAPVYDRPSVIIVGAGPAGYFAALELIELGLKPIILDRGKDVRDRRRDLKAIQQFGEVNPNSNYCFGEGGAGTYSDGKLYTRSHKRGNIYKAMKLFVEHGAKPDILIDAHPHIGSNKLPGIVSNIRATIERYGGEVHFNAFVSDFIYKNGKMLGVIVNTDQEFLGEAVILATGHSARDIYYLLHRHHITIEAKPFALGVRVEHPQPLIDKIQYNQRQREEALPASSYRLACQVGDRGVFSFCMCPGGLVVPAATAPGELVVNGMSMSRRDSAYANSGTVVAVELEDLKEYQDYGVFAGLEFQKTVEQNMFKNGDGSQNAPAQRMTDFVRDKMSKSLPDTSYIPGIHPAPLHGLLPNFIAEKLKVGMRTFGKKMKGYFTDEANVIGTESRTSSPVRIPRDNATYMHDDAEGLFPCGEGAGYAGGIISAAMDGQNVARAVNEYVHR
jgi:uncharacterized FAD-dependent dehydrogenase